MSRRSPKRRRPAKRSRKRPAKTSQHARAHRRRASAEDWARTATKWFVVIMDAFFGPPRLPRYDGFPTLEPEPQPATYRVIEPKALPAPQGA